ncbi:MAG: peptide-methionine (S)-S-oxide reductase MsrA [Candidatus Sungbacteria bacterium]|nr:peptide-methionine (S)-S-oxide reductase MsrA [Candidatus Sungbacteria bacterium]
MKEIAVFGGGCFWCTEAVFGELRGVISVMPGYAGGTKTNPTYEEVCSGKTGHAEVIKIEYDPGRIKFTDLLTVFFATHDPSTPNRQGNDVGTQYRSIILYTNTEQKKQAEEFIKKLNESSPEGKPIVTEIKPLEKFYEAEEYHREYYKKNSAQPYCQIVINPKLEKLQKEFADLLKSHARG